MFQQTPGQLEGDEREDFEADEEDAAVAPRPVQRPGREKTWTQHLAEMVWKVCQSLRGDMMHDKLIALLVEWCEAPASATKCVAYENTCVVYDTTSDVPVIHAPKSAQNNCYVYIPHALVDHTW